MEVYVPDNFEKQSLHVSFIDKSFELIRRGVFEDVAIIAKPEKSFVYGKGTMVGCIDLEKAKRDGIAVSRAPIGSSKKEGVIYFSGETWTFRWMLKGSEEECIKSLDSKKALIKEFYKLLGVEIKEIKQDIEVKDSDRKLGTFYFKHFPEKGLCFGGFPFNLKRGNVDVDDYVSLPDFKFEGKTCKTVNARITTIEEEARELTNEEFFEILKKAMKNVGMNYNLNKQLPPKALRIINEGAVKFESKDWIEKGIWSPIKRGN